MDKKIPDPYNTGKYYQSYSHKLSKVGSGKNPTTPL